MFAYYLDLAWRSLKRNKVLTALMVLAIGLGIGASMTMITVLHVMSGDPLPGLSAQLYVPMLDPRPASHNGGVDDTPDGFTWVDAMNLLEAHHARRQAAMDQGSLAIRPMRAGLHPFFENGEYVTADFFAMFGVPFHAGHGWTAAQDRARARVVVLSRQLARRLFGKADAVGQTVQMNNLEFRVVGVIDAWHPQPRFYAQSSGRIFGQADQFFLPLRTALASKFRFRDHFSCWDNNGDRRESNSCTWVQFWVQLDSAAQARAYQRFLVNYQASQHAHGRFSRNAPPRLYDLMAWLAHEQVVPSNLSMQMWLAVGFLVVCMVSVVALLLAKFLRRSGEVSIRRALGARRRDIFTQFACESALIGVCGGLLGLAIAQIGLWVIRHRPDGYAQLAQMDVFMLVGTVALAVVVSVVAGLLPAWRACQAPPAMQLKAQ